MVGIEDARLRGHDSGRGWDDNAGREGYSSPCSKMGLSYRHKSCFCQSSGKPIAFNRLVGRKSINASRRSLTEEFTEILCSRYRIVESSAYSFIGKVFEDRLFYRRVSHVTI